MFSITPLTGFDLVNITSAASIVAGTQKATPQLGVEVFGNDGKRYVYAQANASIPASTTTCTVAPATFLATATGGAYTSPATAMVTGDCGWFGAASV
jgi:hypothetical protein